MSEIYKTNGDKEKTNMTDEEELVKSHRKLMDSIKKPQTVSKLLEWFVEEENLKRYGKPPNKMFHEVRGAQTGQSCLFLIGSDKDLQNEFFTFLDEELGLKEADAIKSVKLAMNSNKADTLLHTIAKNNKQKEEFATFLVELLEISEADDAVAIVKSSMETGPDLVKMLSAVQEKFPITNVRKWINFLVR